jgi:hypothetical protein
LTSSERLVSAFLTLGITDTSDEKAKTEPVDESEPANYNAALLSPQAGEWKQAMRQEWQKLVENQRSTSWKQQKMQVDLQEKGQSGQLYSLQGTASHVKGYEYIEGRYRLRRDLCAGIQSGNIPIDTCDGSPVWLGCGPHGRSNGIPKSKD